MAPINIRRRLTRSERGSELIEFALVLPVLLLLVLGIVDFGFLFQRLEVVTNAAREGARIAVLPNLPPYTTPDVINRVNAYMQAGGVPIAPGNPTVTVNDVSIPIPGAPSIPSKEVEVRYTYNYLFLSGLTGGTLSSVPLTGVSTMRIEAGP